MIQLFTPRQDELAKNLDLLKNDIGSALEVGAEVKIKRSGSNTMVVLPILVRMSKHILLNNNAFSDHWNERAGTISWSARSPDLAPCDFFLWRHLTNKVYKKPSLKFSFFERVNFCRVCKYCKKEVSYIKESFYNYCLA